MQRSYLSFHLEISNLAFGDSPVGRASHREEAFAPVFVGEAPRQVHPILPSLVQSRSNMNCYMSCIEPVMLNLHVYYIASTMFLP